MYGWLYSLSYKNRKLRHTDEFKALRRRIGAAFRITEAIGDMRAEYEDKLKKLSSKNTRKVNARVRSKNLVCNSINIFTNSIS